MNSRTLVLIIAMAIVLMPTTATAATTTHVAAFKVGSALVWVTGDAKHVAAAGTFPVGRIERIVDVASNPEVRQAGGGRSLILVRRSTDSAVESDDAHGLDLWMATEAGSPSLIAKDAVGGRFDPAGSAIAVTTAAHSVFIHDLLTGKVVRSISAASGVAWDPSGTAVVYSKVQETPGRRALAWIELKSGVEKSLTDGNFDDVRPTYSPDGRWIVFISGARSGIASFWKVPSDGGVPVQVTNRNLRRIDQFFVPTPYVTCAWSPDGRRLAFDFKSDPREEIWVLEFDQNLDVVSSKRVAKGLFPNWTSDSQRLTFVGEDAGAPAIQEVMVP